MTPCRLIVDPPLDGAWNMAVDEALLDEAAERGTATLRFYQWREPTLSLGYFQSYGERQSHPASQGAAVVRRLSGGGALMHDCEVTYSLCLPPSHPMARDAPALYAVVHQTLIGVLGAWNMEAALYCNDDSAIDHSEEPFLCFARRTSADVVLRSDRATYIAAKIVGSAQRRRRGAVLQHGAVLVGASRFAPELAGITDLTGAPLTPEGLIEPWQDSLGAVLNSSSATHNLNINFTNKPSDCSRKSIRAGHGPSVVKVFSPGGAIVDNYLMPLVGAAARNSFSMGDPSETAGFRISITFPPQ